MADAESTPHIEPLQPVGDFLKRDKASSAPTWQKPPKASTDAESRLWVMFGLGLGCMVFGLIAFLSQLSGAETTQAYLEGGTGETGNAFVLFIGLALMGIGNLWAFIAVIGWGVKYGTLAARAHTS